MCTLILLDRVVPGVPLVVAANRDEFLKRPAAPPALFRPSVAGRAAFVAPQDLEAGGTWMGVNESGLFVGLTNRRVANLDRSRRSRGLLVRDGLGFRSTRELLAGLEPALETRYNPFHLLAADGERTALVSCGADGMRWRELEPGIHVVGNRDEDEAPAGKVSRVRAAAERIDPGAPWEEVAARLNEVLSDHGDPDPFENACVHSAEYGTRSSALIALGPARRGYWVAEGPPCRAKFTNCSRLLDDLQQASAYR
jgi:uncharacterized protein with NRDE domain